MNEALVLECVCLLAEARDRVYGADRVLALVWDSFKAHLIDAAKILCRESNIKMVVIPRGLASLLQGLDNPLLSWQDGVLVSQPATAGRASRSPGGSAEPSEAAHRSTRVLSPAASS